MTRKRTRENLVQLLCEPCSFCEGRGYVLSAETVAYKLLREIRKDLPRFGGRQIAVSVSPRVGEMLQGPVRRALAALSEQLGREIEVRTRPGLHQEQFEIEALDVGPAVPIPVPWLESREERAAAEVARRSAAEAERAAAAEEARLAAAAREAAEAAPPDRLPEIAFEVAAVAPLDAPADEIEVAALGEADAPASIAAEASTPVDGSDEVSILPRLQNSEDS